MICSGGTYVRTFAHDVGEQIGCGAHITNIIRTRVGKFELANAVELDDMTVNDLIPLKIALPPLPLVELNETQVGYIRQGRQIIVKNLPSANMVGLTDEDRNVIGVGSVSANMVQPDVVIPADAMAASS